MDKTASENRGRIVCFHLFNDFSGSPMVLKGVLEGLLNKNEKIDLVTSKGGVLDNISSQNLKRYGYPYRFSKNPVVTLMRFGFAQGAMMMYALRYAFKKDTTFYINTILPLGAALTGKLTGKKVVYHYHENAFVKSGLYRFLTKWMEILADEIICVSNYQASFLQRKEEVSIIPNSLQPEFISRLKPDAESAYERRNVLMIASLKEYKGVKEFIEIAGNLRDINFTLVLNASQVEIDGWVKDNNEDLPDNLTIFPRTDDVASFYNNASIVLNLSNPDLVIETFGLTVLEAMSAGLPVIVPPVGGPAEMVEDGFNGYKINVKNKSEITFKIREIFSDKGLYLKLSNNGLAFSKKFSSEEAIKRIREKLL